MPNPDSAGQSDNPDRVRETAEDQGIFNPFMGQAFEDGHWPEDESDESVSESATQSGHRPSRRGGRSYPEKSGRDVSREIANQESEPIDEEQARRDRTGSKAAREILRRANAESDFDYLQQFSTSQQQAILRAREERKRQKSGE